MRVLILVGVVGVLAYAIRCWIWPFTKCGKCDGTGQFQSWWGNSWRRCPRCRGSRERLLTGRRVANFFIRRHRAGRRASGS